MRQLRMLSPSVRISCTVVSAFLHMDLGRELIIFKLVVNLSARNAVDCVLVKGTMTPSLLRLIRHRTTRAYLGKDGGWTDNAAFAQQFEDIRAILKVQRHQRLTEIEVVLQMGPEPSSEYDISLPLDNASG
jgi:hypothetical protein